MRATSRVSSRWTLAAILVCALAGSGWFVSADQPDKPAARPGLDAQYQSQIRPVLARFCFSCHSAKVKKGSLDLERFTSIEQVRQDTKVWQGMIEMLETKQMPPKEKPQPTAEEHKQVLAWIRAFLDSEARARAGDPGFVPLRRLSNAEYNYTVRDMTGVDLQPARAFPADGAAGEGFTNAAEALTDISPTLLDKYFAAAKDIADHAVLLPNGFRFSPSRTRRDWSDECVARIRTFYANYTSDGRLPLTPYLRATVRHRDAIAAGKTTLDALAQMEKLNAKYLRILWQALTAREAGFPMDHIRARWRQATEKDVPGLLAEIGMWQTALWKFVPIGSYRDGNTIRQVANEPTFVASHTVKLKLKPGKDQKEVVLQFASRTLGTASADALVVWHRPRLEGGKQPAVLVRDHSQLEKTKFGQHPQGKPAEEASLVVPANSVTEIRLPADVCRDRELVVEGKLDAGSEAIVQFQVLGSAPGAAASWDGKTPLVGSPASAAAKDMLAGFTAFRRCFPHSICYPHIIPTDEVVCLRQYHREDQLLMDLFLDEAQARQLDRLWLEHRFITQWPITENDYLPQFIGFVTQDQPKQLLAYFEGKREPFRKRADEFRQELEAAGPKQLDALLEFAARAYRRPLAAKEKSDLLGLYAALRKKEMAHEEALRSVLTRVFVAPSFLYRIEQPPAGKAAGPINDWELATRLSYFLWASSPDEELRQAAAAGKLRDSKALADQAQRMVRDDRVRALAIEFGTQWLHVRGFDEHKEKNEQLFPTFDAKLRSAIYEESIRFFQDLFQSNQPVTRVLDADYTFLNDTLARHYGIPGVVGPQWRKVEGVRKYGRGGILGLASVLTKESGASRTSPVLRGNWVVETLLGEKLPRPPANVPKLPEEEKGNDGLTVRQLVEKHASVQACAVCHQRIDPFGFALERYDPIGRLRDKDAGGLPVDTRARLKDGTEFDGIDGLRAYLLANKKDVIERLFCRKLLGYALGRAVALSDERLLDEMVAELKQNEGRVSAAVLTIVRSPQFRQIRGSDFASNH